MIVQLISKLNKFKITNYPFRLEVSAPFVNKYGFVQAALTFPGEEGVVPCRFRIISYDLCGRAQYWVKIDSAGPFSGEKLYKIFQQYKNTPLIVEHSSMAHKTGGSFIARNISVKYFSEWKEVGSEQNETSRTSHLVELYIPIPELMINGKEMGWCGDIRFPYLLDVGEEFSNEKQANCRVRRKKKHDEVMLEFNG